jgi:hypothetical protein
MLNTLLLALVDISVIYQKAKLEYAVMHFVAWVLCAGAYAGISMELMGGREFGCWVLLPHGFAIAVFAAGGFARFVFWVWGKMLNEARDGVNAVFATSLSEESSVTRHKFLLTTDLCSENSFDRSLGWKSFGICSWSEVWVRLHMPYQHNEIRREAC